MRLLSWNIQRKEQFFPGGAASLFLPFFLAAYAAYLYLNSVDLTLHDFPKRMIGIATIEGKDIAARVGMFTRSLMIFLSVFLFSLGGVSLLNRKGWLLPEASKILGNVAIAGLLLLVFAVFNIPVKGSLSLIISVLLLTTFASLLAFFSKSAVLRNFSAAWITVVLSLGMAFYFPLKEGLQYLAGQEQYLPLHPFLLVFGMAVIAVIGWGAERGKITFYHFARAGIPLLFIPLLSVMSDEVYLILNNKGVFSITPMHLYLLGILILVLWVFMHAYKTRHSETGQPEQLIGRVYFPILLLSLGVYTFYEPFLHVRDELFELGNPALGIQRFHLFGEIPLLETFNSHLMAELFFGFLYTFVNGFQGVEYHLYYFLNRVIYGLICYYFFRKALGDPYVAFFLVVLMAYATVLVPRSFYTALLAVFVIHALFRRHRAVDHYLFFAVIAGLILWRIDIGFANLLATTGTVLLLFFMGEKLSPPKLLKSVAAVAGGLLAIVGLLVLWKDIPLIENAQKALHYLSSTQTYGYLEILPKGLAEMEWHYFLFPALIVLFFLYFVLFRLQELLRGKESFAAMAWVYLVLFYLANFQRGIVRHGLVEGTDEVHTSFSYLILSFIPYFFFDRISRSGRLIIFLLASVGLISAFRYGGVYGERNVYQLLGEKIEKRVHVEPKNTPIERAVMPENFAAIHYDELESFLDQHLADSATFLDFSNTPMLYFYTGRRVPSYFNQNLLSIHDDYLQDAYIEHMSDYDIPVVIYANFPRTWFDEVDGVPNQVRHYRIAEHIFRNYAPYAIMDKHTVWLRKSEQVAWPDIEPKHISYEWQMKKDTLQIFPRPVEGGSQSKVFATFESGRKQSPPLLLNGQEMIRPAYEDEKKAFYHINISPSALRSLSATGVDSTFEQSFNLYESRYFPDHYSERPRTFELGELPFIWAEYDEKQEYDLLKKLEDPAIIEEENSWNYSFELLTDKSSGNYLQLILREGHGMKGKVKLSYGKDKEENGAFEFNVAPEKFNYLIRLSMQYRWTAMENNYLRLKFPHGTEHFEKTIESAVLLKGD